MYYYDYVHRTFFALMTMNYTLHDCFMIIYVFFALSWLAIVKGSCWDPVLEKEDPEVR